MSLELLPVGSLVPRLRSCLHAANYPLQMGEGRPLVTGALQTTAPGSPTAITRRRGFLGLWNCQEEPPPLGARSRACPSWRGGGASNSAGQRLYLFIVTRLPCVLFSRSAHCHRLNLCLSLSYEGHSPQKVLIKAAEPAKQDIRVRLTLSARFALLHFPRFGRCHKKSLTEVLS